VDRKEVPSRGNCLSLGRLHIILRGQEKLDEIEDRDGGEGKQANWARERNGEVLSELLRLHLAMDKRRVRALLQGRSRAALHPVAGEPLNCGRGQQQDIAVASDSIGIHQSSMFHPCSELK